MLPRCRKYHDLFVGWNVHSEPSLGGDAEALTSGCFAQLTLETCTLALELASLCVELRQPTRLLDADGPAPNDGKRDHNECREQERHDCSASQCYAAFRHARSLALRERGLEAVSL
jgi:hypothetical protein